MGKGIGLIWKAAVTDVKYRPGQPSQEVRRIRLKNFNNASDSLDWSNLSLQILNRRCNHRLAATGALRCVAARIVRYPFRTIVYFFTNFVSATATISPRSELSEVVQGFRDESGFIQFDLALKTFKLLVAGSSLLVRQISFASANKFSDPAFFFWVLNQDLQPKAAMTLFGRVRD
jgi:hypothetical protein